MKTKNKIGQLPGSLIHVGDIKKHQVNSTLIEYNSNDFNQKECNNIEECLSLDRLDKTFWLNVDGLNQSNIISTIGENLKLHPLLLEDILNTNLRPKVEEFEGYLFFSLKIITVSKDEVIDKEQVSLVLGPNWLVTFQEQEGDVFEAIRIRLKENKGVIRRSKADYLMYSIIDIIVDHYFLIIDYLNDKIEDLEEEILYNPTQESSIKIQNLKRLLMNFRKSILPLRDAVSSLQKYNSNLINEGTLRYFRDIYEHLIHLTDNLDSQRDMLSSIMDLYLSGISNKMNQVMKVLTIISTIFIPLTFITGVYGMNFKNMPELKWEYGYIAIWVIMLVLVILMVVYFKRKKWLE